MQMVVRLERTRLGRFVPKPVIYSLVEASSGRSKIGDDPGLRRDHPIGVVTSVRLTNGSLDLVLPTETASPQGSRLARIEFGCHIYIRSLVPVHSIDHGLKRRLLVSSMATGTWKPNEWQSRFGQSCS